MGNILIIRGTDFSKNSFETVSYKGQQFSAWWVPSFVYNNQLYNHATIVTEAFFLKGGTTYSISVLGGVIDGTLLAGYQISSLCYTDTPRMERKTQGTFENVTTLRTTEKSSPIQNFTDYEFTPENDVTLLISTYRNQVVVIKTK